MRMSYRVYCFHFDAGDNILRHRCAVVILTLRFFYEIAQFRLVYSTMSLNTELYLREVISGYGVIGVL